MPKQSKSKWERLHERAVGAARRLTSKLAPDALPVRLRPIVLGQHARVTFQPLFVEGGLGVDEEGFAIYINVPEDRAAKIQQDFEDATDGELSLTTRQRFTLAHELAHTFFFEIPPNSSKPRSLVGGHPKEHERLESECNELAGILLVPDSVLSSAIAEENLDLLDPRVILGLAKRFAVSLDCLVRRLHTSLLKHGADGGIVVVPADGPLPSFFPHALTSRAYEVFAPDQKLNLGAIARCRQEYQPGLEMIERNVLVPRKSGDQLVRVTSLAIPSSEKPRSILGLRLIEADGPVNFNLNE